MSLPAWAQRLPLDIIQKEANERGLDWRLIAALCRQESSGNQWAQRYEPNATRSINQNFWKYASLNGITPQTESIAECTSFGLLQVMGYVARSLGFDGPLTRLCDPETGVHYGCLLLCQLFKRFTELDAVVSSYNQGSPRKGIDGKYLNYKNYVLPVLGYMAELSADNSPPSPGNLAA